MDEIKSTTFHFIWNGEKVGASYEDKIILPCVFDDVSKVISHGYWIVKKDGKWGYYGEVERKFYELPIYDQNSECAVQSMFDRLKINKDQNLTEDTSMKLLLKSFLRPNVNEVYKILSENEKIADLVVRIWRNQADYKISKHNSESYKEMIDQGFYDKCAKIYSLEDEFEQEI